ncbi:hypothetical protein ACFW2V_12500 [Streptomyces sp. NPDC058947]|uniref:hypothetical protein n=1 Tax=Streptomyces sp. NPDC058947 TaxID=3346675 RepID=UPI0036BBE54F
MTGEAEVEISTTLSDDGVLSIFLYHPDSDGRAEAEEALLKEGAEFTTYPHGRVSARINGSVSVNGTNITIIAGPLYVIGALEVPSAAAIRARNAVLYMIRQPFVSGDLTERTVLSAALPLGSLKEEAL